MDMENEPTIPMTPALFEDGAPIHYNAGKRDLMVPDGLKPGMIVGVEIPEREDGYGYYKRIETPKGGRTGACYFHALFPGEWEEEQERGNLPVFMVKLEAKQSA